MVDKDVETEVSAYDSAIFGLSDRGYVPAAMKWLGTMLKSRLKPQKKTFDSLVQCLSKADRLSDALFVYDKRDGTSYVKPKNGTTTIVVNEQ
ncbi:Hypothetical predicted protein [Olea europaea subsp. europaea]|uniref:Pentatricopeptide repeat-containing protein n=1 Tax=Olea europaea subsp. europaea TaxID=158383 RepID=A0A8S0QSU5_OLEEU|nr:Hypothetical predicted protein [Olea europaea subsp. europaea]